MGYILTIEDGYAEQKLRAIKAIDEKENSITLAGSIPQNSMVSFAKANLDELVDAAQEAAEILKVGYNTNPR